MKSYTKSQLETSILSIPIKETVLDTPKKHNYFIIILFYVFSFYFPVFGFFEGCYVCQVAVITGDIVGIDRMEVAVGILFGIKSVPLTLGPPIAGSPILSK